MMNDKRKPLIQLVGYQRASSAKTCAAIFDFGVHATGLVLIGWVGYHISGLI